MASNYTEASIKTLSSLEHIRLRPGMYIGRLGNGAHCGGRHLRAAEGDDR
jgi:topoisomerase-4 subunit B